MRTFIRKLNPQGSVARSSIIFGPHNSPVLPLQRTRSNQAVQPLLEPPSSKAVSPQAQASHRGHDFSCIPVHPGGEAGVLAPEDHGSWALGDKSVDGNSDNTFGLVEDNGPDGGKGSKDAGVPDAAPKKKKAGVDSFVVKWKKNSISGPKTAKLRLDYSAKFKKDDMYDPALAEFRQNAFHTFEVTEGPNKGQKHNNPPLHDDNYSRADDTAGNTINDTKFVSNDNPGTPEDSLDTADVIDYSFTAEQMIIDTSDGDKIIERRGPHTATIKGKHRRKFDGVPKKMS
jgi:hypothetical protein